MTRQCRFCKCHGDHCKLPDGELCGWYRIGESRSRESHGSDVCNAPGCIRAFHALEKRESRAALQRLRKPSPGTIHQRMMAERQAKRRQQRARAKAKKTGGAA